MKAVVLVLSPLPNLSVLCLCGMDSGQVWREGGCLFEMVWREKGIKGTVRQRNSSAHPAAPGDTMSVQGRTGMKSWL